MTAESRSTEPITLVLRLWFEGSGAAGEWRGEIRDVITGERRYFRGVDGALPVLRELIELRPAGDERGS